MRRVAAPLQRLAHQWVVISLVGRQVLLTRRAGSGALDRDARKRRAHRPRVVAVRPRHLQADGRTTLVSQDVALRAQLAAIHRAFARRLAAQRRLRRGGVYRLPAPPNAAQLVILLQEQSLDALEDAARDPLLETAVERRPTTELAGCSLPLTARAQHVEYAVEAGAVWDGRPADGAGLLLWPEQRAHLVPQIVRDVPYRLKGGLACHDFASPKQSLKHSTTAL